MSLLKRFFQEDVPNTFSTGKWRVNLIKLNNRLTQLEKQKTYAIGELGAAIWNNRIIDASYEDLYKKLELMEAPVNETLKEIGTTQNELNLETKNLETINLDFKSHLNDIQNQKQVSVQKLTLLQASLQNTEQQIKKFESTFDQGNVIIQQLQNQISQLSISLDSEKEIKVNSLNNSIADQQTIITDASNHLEPLKQELNHNLSEQQLLKQEVEGFDQLINVIRSDNKTKTASIQEKIQKHQQLLVSLDSKKSNLVDQMSSIMPELGKRANTSRPFAEVLNPLYAKIDTLQDEINNLKNEINIFNARIASINPKSLQRVLITAGMIITLVILLILMPSAFRLSTKKLNKSIHLINHWTLYGCSVDVISDQSPVMDISIWENRNLHSAIHATFNIKLYGANNIVLDSESDNTWIPPNEKNLIIVNLDPKGSRIENIKRSVVSETAVKRIYQQMDINVEPYFEKTMSSNNNVLKLEISNLSDFGFTIGGDPYVFVINTKNELVDILSGYIDSYLIPIDSMATFSFDRSSLAFCGETDYSQEQMTYWYFIPISISDTQDQVFMISGKVDYKP